MSMDNSDFLNRYRAISDHLRRLCEAHFSISATFTTEVVEHALSTDDILAFLSSQELPSDELALSILTESKRWLSSLNFSFDTLSLDQISDDHGYEVSFEGDDDFSENEPLEEATSAASLRHVLNEESRNDPTVQARLKLVAKLFPNGVTRLPEDKRMAELSDGEIILFYKHVYLQLIPAFPLYFFRDDADRKIRLIVEFLQSEILDLPVANFADEGSIEFLTQHKLAPIARLKNYSWSNVMNTTYPSRFLPWEHGHVDDGYWNDHENRKRAFRWVIETYFNTKPTHIWKIYQTKKYSRKLFGKLGLSYLYNTYYNGVLSTLEDAYPELEYWQFGLFPDSYWEQEHAKENAVEAFRWMLNELGISKKTLLSAISNKILRRQTFRDYNLSTMFDYVFNRNLFDLIDATFPDQFKAWEVGKVRRDFWENDKNKSDAIRWFMKEKGMSQSQLLSEIDTGAFQRKTFVQSKLATFFRHIFGNDPMQVFRFLTRRSNRVEYENLRLVHLLKKRSKSSSKKSLMYFILHGFNYGIHKHYEEEMAKRINRKLARRKRILDHETK